MEGQSASGLPVCMSSAVLGVVGNGKEQAVCFMVEA